MADIVKNELDKLFAESEKTTQNPRTQKVKIEPEKLREIIPEAKRSKLNFPPLQFAGLLLVLLPIAFAVTKCVAPGNPHKVEVQPMTVLPAQASTTTVICGPANEQDPTCKLRKLQAENSIAEQKGKIKPPPGTSAKPLPKAPPTMKISSLPPSQVPQQYRSQPTFRRDPQRSFPQQNFIQRSSVPPVQKQDAETIWNQMSKDGVTGGGGNNFTPPSSEPEYVSDLAINSQEASSMPAAQSFKGEPKSQGEGVLETPIQLTSDRDAANDEFKIRVTKAVGAIAPGSFIYAKIEGTPSQAGFIELKPVGSPQGDVASVEIKKSDGSLLKAKMKGTGRGFLNTVATILFGGARIAMGGFFGGGGALNSMAQNASNEAINAGQSAFQNRRAAPYFEISKGTTVKLLQY